MAGERITIDISILQGIFGDLAKLQQQLSGVAGGAVALDNSATAAFADVQKNIAGVTRAVGGMEGAFDAGMRNVVADIMQPVAKTQELNDKLARLGSEVRTSRSVGEIVKLKKEIAATQRELDGVNPGAMERKVSGAAGRMRGMFAGLAGPLVGAFAVGGMTAFAGDLAKMAGAQQQFDSSLKNMLQSKERADALSAQVKSFAATTPFELPEVQKATTQMLAFGFGAEDAIPTLRKLGDVAAGLGQPVGDLAYLYGTTRVQGRLYTNDLMQFANRGIPIIEELAKVLGVSQASVKEMVEKGAVNFGHLEGVFQNLTAEGSKFGGLMEAQSQTITGQISNLSDAWGQFKTDMGLALAPVITGLIESLSSGVEYLRRVFAWVQVNGDTIIGVIKGVAIAVGIYTTALLINNRVQLLNNALQAVAAVRMGAMAAVTNLVSAATTVWTGVQWLLNAALSADPIGLVIAAIAALVAGVIYAWNRFEGFRAFLYGLWETIKVVFGAAWDYIVGVFKGLGDIAMGFANIVMGAFALDWKQMKAGWSQMKSGFTDILPDPLDVARGAIDLGKKVGTAYAAGAEKGRADFRAGKAESKPGAVTARDLVPPAPGQNVGAASLLGGAQGGDGAKKGGVTVGGEGSGRVITMTITMNNAFNLPRDANMGAREVADRVIGDLVRKLNDAQYAMG